MALVACVARSAGGPALRRAGPVYGALAIVLAVPLGSRYGMRPKDVAEAADLVVGVRLALWLLWLALLAGAARALFRTEGLRYVRWMPIARWQVWAAQAFIMLALELPWVALWGLGSGLDAGLAAGLGAAAAHVGLGMTVRNRLDSALTWAGLVGLAALIAVDPAPIWLIGAGAVTLAVAVPAAWARAPEGNARRRPVWMPSRPIPALVVTYLRGVARARGSNLLRAAFAICLGAGLMALLARANSLEISELAVYSAAVASVTLSLATAGLAGPVIESERALGWIAATAGLTHNARLAARALATAGLGGSCGLLYGLLVIWWADLSAPAAARIAAGAVAMGYAMSLFASRASRWAERAARENARGKDDRAGELEDRSAGQRDAQPDARIESGRVSAAMIVAVILAWVAITWLDDLACLGLAALATALLWERR